MQSYSEAAKQNSAIPLGVSPLDILACWAAKLNEFEIGQFNVVGNFMLFDDNVRILRRVNNGAENLYYEVFFYENGMDELSTCAFCPYLRNVTPSLIRANALPSYAIYLAPFKEQTVLTSAFGAALGWKLFGRYYDLEISELSGANLHHTQPLDVPFDCDLDIIIPPLSREINVKYYMVTMQFRCWFGRDLVKREFEYKIHPANLVHLGYDGICRTASLFGI